MADDVDDGTLAVRISAGTVDVEAEAEVCRRFAPRIRHYGLRHLRDEAAADDLVQEVLALTLTSLREGRLRDPAMLASFVLGSCRLVARNGLRTEQRRRGLLELYAAEHPATTHLEPVENFTRLAGCIEQLTERERTIIALTYYAEQTGQRIAAELGLSHANVRVVRHRALARLLGCMAGFEEAP